MSLNSLARAVCAALIGSCYLASFCAAKRLFAKTAVLASHATTDIASLASATGRPFVPCSDPRGAAKQEDRGQQVSVSRLMYVPWASLAQGHDLSVWQSAEGFLALDCK